MPFSAFSSAFLPAPYILIGKCCRGLCRLALAGRLLGLSAAEAFYGGVASAPLPLSRRARIKARREAARAREMMHTLESRVLLSTTTFVNETFNDVGGSTYVVDSSEWSVTTVTKKVDPSSHSATSDGYLGQSDGGYLNLSLGGTSAGPLAPGVYGVSLRLYAVDNQDSCGCAASASFAISECTCGYSATLASGDLTDLTPDVMDNIDGAYSGSGTTGLTSGGSQYVADPGYDFYLPVTVASTGTAVVEISVSSMAGTWNTPSFAVDNVTVTGESFGTTIVNQNFDSGSATGWNVGTTQKRNNSNTALSDRYLVQSDGSDLTLTIPSSAVNIGAYGVLFRLIALDNMVGGSAGAGTFTISLDTGGCCGSYACTVTLASGNLTDLTASAMDNVNGLTAGNVIDDPGYDFLLPMNVAATGDMRIRINVTGMTGTAGTAQFAVDDVQVASLGSMTVSQSTDDLDYTVDSDDAGGLPNPLEIDSGGNATVHIDRPTFNSALQAVTAYEVDDTTTSSTLASGYVGFGTGADASLSGVSQLDALVVTTWLDANSNGVLDSNEMASAKYVYLSARSVITPSPTPTTPPVMQFTLPGGQNPWLYNQSRSLATPPTITVRAINYPTGADVRYVSTVAETGATGAPIVSALVPTGRLGEYTFTINPNNAKGEFVIYFHDPTYDDYDWLLVNFVA